MVDAGGDNFVFWFSRNRENSFLDTLSKNFVFCLKCFLFSRKWRGRSPPAPPAARALSKLILSTDSSGGESSHHTYRCFGTVFHWPPYWPTLVTRREAIFLRNQPLQKICG